MNRQVKSPYPYNNEGRCRWCNGMLKGKQKLWDSVECKMKYYATCGYYVKYIVYEFNMKKNNGIAKCNMCNKVVEYEECNADHIVPLSLGGTNDIENFQLLCLKCHREKTNNDLKMLSQQRKKQKEIEKLKHIRKLYDFTGVGV